MNEKLSIEKIVVLPPSVLLLSFSRCTWASVKRKPRPAGSLLLSNSNQTPTPAHTHHFLSSAVTSQQQQHHPSTQQQQQQQPKNRPVLPATPASASVFQPSQYNHVVHVAAATTAPGAAHPTQQQQQHQRQHGGPGSEAPPAASAAATRQHSTPGTPWSQPEACAQPSSGGASLPDGRGPQQFCARQQQLGEQPQQAVVGCWPREQQQWHANEVSGCTFVSAGVTDGMNRNSHAVVFPVSSSNSTPCVPIITHTHTQ